MLSLPRKFNYFLLLLIALSSLNGCQHLSTHPIMTTPPTFAAAQLQHWSLIGKLGARLEHRAFSAQLIWQQQQDHYELTLQGPLGQGSVKITGDKNQMTLHTAEETIQSLEAESLLKDQLGWSIPIQALAWWIKGLPMPEQTFSETQYDEQHHLSHFIQQDWQITLTDYRMISFENNPLIQVELPHRILLEKSPLKLTVVISQWQPLL